MKRKEWVVLNNEMMLKDEMGNYRLGKDKEAAHSYFINYVNKHTVFFHNLREKLDHLIKHDYYIDFYSMYTHDEIKEIFEIAYKNEFRFPSFMSASKFYTSYALRDNTGENFLERYEDRLAAVALYLAQGDFEKAKRFVIELIEQRYQPATPTFLNAGRSRAGKLVSCFLDEIGDDLNGIGYAIDSAMKLSSIGGGVAFNLSKLRARSEMIKGIDGRASGVLPIMKILEDVFSYANQLGQRAGAGAVYLNIFHYDIEEFLDSKKINVDEKIRIKSLSIGLIVPDKFMELVETDAPYYVFKPHSVYREYGEFLDDMDIDKVYDELLENPRVEKKKLNARHMLVKIASTQKESGYPYLFFKSTANREHALKNIGSVKFSNLCTEIMQLSEVSSLGSYYEDDIIRRGISCNLGSLNIVNVMEDGNIERSVVEAMEMLSAVQELTSIDVVPSIKKANDELKSVGLGAMNLHGFFAKNHIDYESKEALDFVNVFFMIVNYHSLDASRRIALRKGERFLGFEDSEYASGKYFDKYLEKDFSPKTKSVADLFSSIFVPSPDDWARLKESVMKDGLYHAYRLAIAPNQSSAYVQSATPSIMPIVDVIEVREYGDSSTFYPMPYLSEENFKYYRSAYDMDQTKVMKLVSVIQRHVDQGISAILHTKSEDSTRTIAKYYIYAHKLGLKSLYYTRTRKSVIQGECLSCQV